MVSYFEFIKILNPFAYIFSNLHCRHHENTCTREEMDPTSSSVLQFGAGGVGGEYEVEEDGNFEETANPIPNVFKTYRMRFGNDHNNLMSRLHEYVHYLPTNLLVFTSIN